jgi:hypothetical protein
VKKSNREKNEGASMELDFFLTQMSTHAGAISSLTLGIPAEKARWKPDPEKWSILEVINHLYDEERLDFRLRLDIILYHPNQSWPPINPQGWVTERAYNERDLVQSVDDFLKERQKSLAWLKGLENPDWNASVTAPFGQFSPPGWPMIYYTCVSWLNCTGPAHSRQRNHTRSIMPVNGRVKSIPDQICCLNLLYRIFLGELGARLSPSQIGDILDKIYHIYSQEM